MRKYKEKDRVYIHWEKTPFAKTALRESFKKIGIVKSISGRDYIVTEYDAKDRNRTAVLYENELSLYVGKASEGDLL